MALIGCRDYEDIGSRRLDDFDVLAGRADSEGGPRLMRDDIIAGHFVSTDADLVPLRDQLRTMAWDLRGDILGAFTLTLPRGFITDHAGSRTVSHATSGTSFSIDVATLIAETQATPGTAVANMVVPPTFSLDTARSFLDHLNFTLLKSEIDVRWATTGAPVLEIHLPLDVDVDPKDFLPIDPPNGRLDVVVDVTFAPNPRTGPVRFVDFFAPGHPLRDDYVAVSLGLHVGSLTGLGDFLGTITPTVMTVVGQVSVFLGTLRTPITSFFPLPASTWTTWCAGRPGGCPFSSAALAQIAANGGLHTEGSIWRLLDGRTVTLASTNVFDQSMLDLLATGGTMTTGQLIDTFDTQAAACGRCSASGGSTDCNICSACRAPTDFQIAWFCIGRPVPLPVSGATAVSAPACPLVAQLEEATFAVSDQLRGVAAEPAHGWTDFAHPVVYSSIRACPGLSSCAAGVEFSFPNDEDGDGVPWIIDNCPIPNPDQLDSDGDGRGDACDPCPFTPGWSGTDSDGDGIPDLCDCDADNDGCNNRVLDGAGHDVCPLTGETYDQLPHIANPFDTRDHDGDGNRTERLDWDGDGIMDDCDLDDDGDGVPDTTDNCHFVANPGQEDTDGNHVGDACDPWCTGPTDPHCGSGPFTGGFIDWIDRLGHLPAMPHEPWCIVDGPGCMFLVSIEIPQLGKPSLVLRDGVDGNVYQFDIATLGVPSLDGGIVAVPDLDHDGRPDLVIGVPSQERLVAVSAATGKQLWSWPVPVTGHAGTALVADGNTLWVGVPDAKLDAQTSPGAVLRVELAGLPRATRLAWGTTNGERFGATLDSAHVGGDTLVVVGAPYAPTAKGKTSGQFTVLDGRARPLLAISGLAANAGPGSLAKLVVANDKLQAVVVGQSSYGNANGAIAVYDATGKMTWAVTGAVGDRLGTSLAILPSANGLVIAGGSPGANGGDGAVSAYKLAGGLLQTAKGVKGSALGIGLAALPDLDHDGRFELALGGTTGYTVLSTKP